LGREEGTVSGKLICGVDEAGRGPLAGPVTAAAVILPTTYPLEELADSKALSPARRLEAARLIRRLARAWAVGWAWPEEIDRLNIHHATLLAMERAIRSLAVQPEEILVDGLFTPRARVPCTAVVRGDATVPQIMAASILAKTFRDSWMERYSRIEPAYGFDRHKGYPTEEHRSLICALGCSPIHRRSFRLTPGE
jgi:ribonuclease HII